ncbi:undecaprenyl-diphosphate phosphatase [Alteribacter natronophilus]|uniref:undecaprenyl-diphosphate phosphatase n=1 Tax=Alteribacter natronophilus TaxID=2583810 RepID=UPI00110E6E89|nr:undecaprenyl-diphosphate phosphatase [Alteribacter natronophilus]TMW72022.1 UDP pyrophosphate phosphatase [Alteribacter natronophilus]
MEFFELLKYIILGIIQGATEPLPVSSSGHLRIVSYFFGLDVPDLHFEIFVNGASLVAVFIIYRKDLIELAAGAINYVRKPKEYDKEPFRFTLLLILGTIPAVIGGLFLYDFIGGELTHIRNVGFALLITGVALWLIRNLRGHKKEPQITVFDTIIIGLAQTLALAPGISRSGATIVAALARKIEPETALKFSFFLSIPVSIGSLVFDLRRIYEAITTPGMVAYYIVAFTVALIVSIFAIKLLINMVTRGKLLYFAIYCFVMAGILIISQMI